MPSPKRFRSSSCPYLGLNNLEKNPAGTLDLLSFNSSEIKDCFVYTKRLMPCHLQRVFVCTKVRKLLYKCTF